MIPYIIVGVVAVLLAAVAYRALGGREAAHPVDSALLLDAALDGATRAAAVLEEAGGEGGRGARRLLDTCSHRLELVATGDLDDARLSAHALLVAAVEQLGWAARMLQSQPQAGAQGMQQAVTALHTDAVRCLRAAREMLGRSAVAEEVGDPA